MSLIDNTKLWLDTDGNVIQAHGGQVQQMTYENAEGKTVTEWIWIGEEKTNGAHGGICIYSSTDLVTWKSHGIVMRNIQSRELLDTDEYFVSLYGNLSSEQKDHVYKCINSSRAIIERPKLIYNAKTKTYIIWFHADGPTETHDTSYAAASSGVAVSKNIFGPYTFVERYRLNECPEGMNDFYPESKGMARDMNLWTDDDGTAYIIYSSEENKTMYISKLNDEYTGLATPKEKAVYGKDFIRIFPGAKREAPAMFKKDGKYYLMTSYCTGWDPNQAKMFVADSVLGEWKDLGDPCVGDEKHTTFDTQSTCFFKVNGKYIYMGDRWLPDDLKNSPYIWLPVKFKEDGTPYLEYVDNFEI